MLARETGEPRWHSGKQVKRASARLALRLLACVPPGCCPPALLPRLRKAALALNHHGSQVPAHAAAHLGNVMQGRGRAQGNGRAGKNAAPEKQHDSQPNDDWLCKSCIGKNGLPFRNHGCRIHCHLCKLAKGSCFGRKAQPRPEDIVAKRALDKQRAAERTHAAELKKLKEELAEARKAAVPAKEGSASAQGTMELDGEGPPAGAANSDLDAAVAAARDKLKKVKDLPDPARPGARRTRQVLRKVAGRVGFCASRPACCLPAQKATRRRRSSQSSYGQAPRR